MSLDICQKKTIHKVDVSLYSKLLFMGVACETDDEYALETNIIRPPKLYLLNTKAKSAGWKSEKR